MSFPILSSPPLLGQDIVTTDRGNRGRGRPERQPRAPRANAYIATFVDGTTYSDRAQVAEQAGATVRRNFRLINAAALTVPNQAAHRKLLNSRSVLRIVPDRKVYEGIAATPAEKTASTSSGTTGSRQLTPVSVQRVGPATAGSDGTGVGVAVLDSGCDYNHADLNPAPDNPGVTCYNAFNPAGSCQDDRGHGTHVAGIIGAQNNNLDVVGVAPAATLYCVKVLDSTGTGDESDVIAGMQWVADNYDQVIPEIRAVNMSLGRPLEDMEDIDTTPMLPAVQALYNLGIAVVVSAGNDPNGEVTDFVPAGYAEVFAVAGTVATDGIDQCPVAAIPTVTADSAASFTTDGAFVGGRGVTASAPGEERLDTVSNCAFFFYGTLSTTLGGGATRKIPAPEGLQEARGTSFAAPLVTGIVARMMQLGMGGGTGNSNEVELIRTAIRNTADRKQDIFPNDPGAAPFDNPWGPTSPFPVVIYTFDGEREGIAQAPVGPTIFFPSPF